MPSARILLAALAALVALAPGEAQRRTDFDAAREGVKAGHVRPLHEIEQRVVPRMGGADYLGPEFDAGSGIYRLKFMRAGSVIWIDVDGRTGAVIGRSGN